MCAKEGRLGDVRGGRGVFSVLDRGFLAFSYFSEEMVFGSLLEGGFGISWGGAGRGRLCDYLVLLPRI